MRDSECMARAVVLGQSVRRDTAPNPWVGCVIVRDGAVVGEGATDPPGGPHAEVVALGAAGDRARGATAFVTLEPCSHHGRTPPCADALITAGIARVVVAIEDPDPAVSGRGIAALRGAGVEVEVGTGSADVQRLLAPYLHHRRTGRAYCVLKTAVSLDGRVAASDGSSRWITGEVARADVHALRAESEAVVVGAGTACADQPSLTVRDAPAPRHAPLRVLLDARGRVAAEGPLFDAALAPTLVITTDAVDAHALDAWRAEGAKVETVAATPEGVNLVAALEVLGRHGVLQALVEGGPTLHGALWDADLVDRLIVYVGNTVLGADAVPMLPIPGPSTITGAPRLALTGLTRLGDDVRLDYEMRSDG